MVRFFRVKGESMLPLLAPGDLVLALDWYWLAGRLCHDDQVVFRHPDYGILIKRVDEIDLQRQSLTVRGTRPVSLDSQEFGPIPLANILGKVVWRIRRRA